METTHEFKASVLTTIEGYTPSRPAPACSNPSSPIFSDDGDPAEFEEIKAVLNIAGKLEIELTDDQADAIYDVFSVQIERDYIDSVNQY